MIALLGSCHPITHNLPIRINRLADLNADGVVPDFLHAFPNRFGAGMAVAFAGQETAEAGNQAYHVAEFGRFGGRFLAFPSTTLRTSFDNPRGLPFLGVEYHIARQVGTFAAQRHHVQNAPGDDQV